MLGQGANILVGDRGIRGAVIDTRLLNGIYRISHMQRMQIVGVEQAQSDTAVVAECGATITNLCEEALIHQLSGLENFMHARQRRRRCVYECAMHEDDIACHIRTLICIITKALCVVCC